MRQHCRLEELQFVGLLRIYVARLFLHYDPARIIGRLLQLLQQQYDL